MWKLIKNNIILFISLIVILVLSALLFWSDLNNLNSFRGNLGGDWLGYFGSLVGSLITALVFYLTLSFEHQKLRIERLEKDKQEIIEARPIFYISKSDNNSTELEVYSKNGIPLKKVDAIVKYKNSERESLSLSLKIDTKILTGDIEYLKIESLNIKNEKNYFVYNAQENREFNFSDDAYQGLFHERFSGLNILELYALIEYLCDPLYQDKELKEVMRAHYKYVFGKKLQNNEIVNLRYEFGSLSQIVYKQSPLSEIALSNISKITLYLRLGQGTKQIEAIYYQAKADSKDKQYLSVLMKIISAGYIEVSDEDTLFIGKFTTHLEKFYNDIDEPVLSVIDLFDLEKLNSFFELLYNNYSYASNDIRRLPSYVLKYHYSVTSFGERYLSEELLFFVIDELLL